MSILQTTYFQPSLCVRNTSQSLHLSSKAYILPVHAKLPLQNPYLATRNASNQQQCLPILKNQKCRAASRYQHFHLSAYWAARERMEVITREACAYNIRRVEKHGSPWKALENAMGNLKKESSIEDVLRKQIEKKEFYKDKDSATRGGGRGRGGGGGAGGSGRGGAGGSSGSEDEGFARIIDETFQVILATIGFIFLYVYIISGEEWTRLAKDYLKFLFKGSESARLKRAMDKWGRFYQKLTEKLYDKVGEGHNQYPNLVG